MMSAEALQLPPHRNHIVVMRVSKRASPNEMKSTYLVARGGAWWRVVARVVGVVGVVGGVDRG